MTSDEIQKAVELAHARESEPTLADAVLALVAELASVRATKCAKPGVAMCAKQWEADHQRRALVECGLADEFAYGCDAIEAVCEALLAARADRDRLAAVVERYEAARRHIADMLCVWTQPEKTRNEHTRGVVDGLNEAWLALPEAAETARVASNKEGA